MLRHFETPGSRPKSRDDRAPVQAKHHGTLRFPNVRGVARKCIEGGQQKGHVQEIGIDGRTGKVVENKSEGKIDRD